MKIIRQVVAALVLALAVVVVQDRRAVEASHYGYSCPDMQAQCRNMGGTPYYNSECAAGTNPFVWEVCVLPWSPSHNP